MAGSFLFHRLVNREPAMLEKRLLTFMAAAFFLLPCSFGQGFKQPDASAKSLMRRPEQLSPLHINPDC
jgi:hypothetical protein